MKALITALALVTTVPAAAQQYELPRTIVLKNPQGETVGFGTQTGNRIVIRNTNKVLLGTVVLNEDGSKTLYDPDGKLVRSIQSSNNGSAPLRIEK